MKFLKPTLVLLVASLCFSCKKDVGYLVNGTTNGTSNNNSSSGGSTNTNSSGAGEYYFKGTLASSALSWQGTDDASGWVTGSASAVSNSQGVLTGSLTALFS